MKSQERSVRREGICGACAKTCSISDDVMDEDEKEGREEVCVCVW